MDSPNPADKGVAAFWPRRLWHVAEPDLRAVDLLAGELSLPRPLALALASRGVSDTASASSFLAPRLACLAPPERFPGLPEAVARIRAAGAAKEPVLVFGDFDADGLTASAVLVTALEKIGASAVSFIPDRESEGYGFTEAAVRRALSEHPGTRLVVTVDCGISQHAGVAVCASRNVDVIITDHHTLPETLPPALAVIHPALPGVPESAAGLAGVGVAFKLAHALARGPDGKHLFDVASLLPLVALGTVADIVPLVGDNRLLVSAGLVQINRKTHPGIEALRSVCGLRRAVQAVDLAFRLGPRVNAAGRIGNTRDAFELLHGAPAPRLQELASGLDALNAERQSMEREACDEALAFLRWDAPTDACSAVVLGETWNAGILGLVASRVSQRLGVPAIALRPESDGSFRGSARCPAAPGLHLMNLLEACSGHLARFGGHRAAAGLSVKAGCLETFRSAFEAACRAAMPGGPVKETLEIDAWVSPDLLTLGFHRLLQRLEPTGEANPRPRWGMRGLTLTCAPIAFGKEGQHRRFLFYKEGDSPIEAVFFNLGDTALPWQAGDRLDIAFTTEESDFTGGLQILLEDVRDA